MPQRLIRVTNPTTHETMVTSWPHQSDPTDDEINSMLAGRRSENLGKIEEAGRTNIPWYQRAAAQVPEPLVRGLQAFDWHPIEALKEVGAGAKQVVTGVGEEEQPRIAGFRKMGRGAFGVVAPPMLAAGSIVAPLPTAAVVGTGVAASYARPHVERGIEELGAYPELAGLGLDVAELAAMVGAGKGGMRARTMMRGRAVPLPPPPVAPAAPISKPAAAAPPVAPPDLQAEIARVTDAIAEAAQRGDHATILALRPQVAALIQRTRGTATPAPTTAAAPTLPAVPPPTAPLQDARAFEAKQFTKNVEGRPPNVDALGAQQIGRNVREAIGDVPPPEGFRLDLEEDLPPAFERNVEEAMRGARPVEAGELELEPSPEITQFVSDFKRDLNRRLAGAQPEPPTPPPTEPPAQISFGARAEPLESGAQRSPVTDEIVSLEEQWKARQNAPDPLPSLEDVYAYAENEGMTAEQYRDLLRQGLATRPEQPPIARPRFEPARDAVLGENVGQLFPKPIPPVPPPIPTTRPMLREETAEFGAGRGTTTAEAPRPLPWRGRPPIGGGGFTVKEWNAAVAKLRGPGLEPTETPVLPPGSPQQVEPAPIEQRVAPERGGEQALIDEMRSRGIGFTDLLTELRNRMRSQSDRAEAFGQGAAERLRKPMGRQALPAVEPFVPPTTEAPTELPRVVSPQEVRLQQQYDSTLAKIKTNPLDPGMSTAIDTAVSAGRMTGKTPEEVGVDLLAAGLPPGIMVPRVRRGFGMAEPAPEPEQILQEKTGFGKELRKQRTGAVPIQPRTPGEMRRAARPFDPTKSEEGGPTTPAEVEWGDHLRRLWHDEEGQLDLKELAKGLARVTKQARESFVNVARLEGTSGREHMKKFGPAGVQGDTLINDFYMLRHKYHGEMERSFYWKWLVDAGADKDQALWQQIVARLGPEVAEGKRWTVEPNPTADAVARKIRVMDDAIHERMRERGVRGVGSEELGYVEDHFPHMYPEEMWGDVISQLAQQLHEAKRFPNVASAQEFVNNVIRSQGERIAPNIQLPRTTENAALIRTDRAVLPEYYLQVADKLAEAEVLGPKGKGSALPAKILNLASEIYETTKSRAQMEQFLDLAKKALNPEPLSPMKAEVWQKTHSAMVLTKMGLSFLANSPQFLYQYVLTGMKPMIKSASRLVGEYRTSGKDFLGDAAVTSDNFLQWLRYREGVGRTAGGWLLQRVTPFAAEERLVNRPFSYSGGFWLEELYNKLKTDPQNKYVRRQLDKFLQIDPDKLLTEGLTEDMKQRATFSMAQKTQFGYNPLETPGGWGTTLTSRMRHEFMNFAFNAMKFTKDAVYGELKHGNPMPLIRMLAAGQLAGEVVADLNAVIRGKERPDDIVLRMIDNQVTWGAFGIASSIFMSLGITGGLTALAIGAAPSTVAGYMQSAWPTSRPGSLIRRAVGDIPIVGKTIAGYAFPRKQPIGRVPPPFPRQQSRPRGAPKPF